MAQPHHHHNITTIGNPALSAGFLVECGMLGVSLRHNGHEFVALPSSIEQYCAGKLTGIPLMHPWANRLRSHTYQALDSEINLPATVPADGNGLPMHGIMHGKPFVLAAQTSNALQANFEFVTAPLLELFPYPHRITVQADIEEHNTGGVLTIVTSVTNLGDSPMPISFGWHPYLVGAGAPRADWRFRVPPCTRHLLDHQLLPTGTTELFHEFDGPIGTSTFDDHFALDDDRQFVIATEPATITVTFDSNYPFAQLYVPPDNGTGHRDFVCVEPMAAQSNALGDGVAPMLARNATFRAAFSIAIT